ncbi:MAG: lipopolysaccharide biosynthesis protein [Planctomycetota bacterium]
MSEDSPPAAPKPSSSTGKLRSSAVFRGLRWSVGSSASTQIIRLVASLYLAREFLSPEDFGLVAMAGIVLNFLRVLRDMGTVRAMVTREHLTDDLVHTVFWLNLGVGAVLCLSVALLAGPASYVLGDPKVQMVLVVMSSGLLMTALESVPRAVLQHRLDFQRIAIAEGVSLLVFLGTAFGLAIKDYKVWALVSAMVAGQFAMMTTMWILSKYWPRVFFSRERFKEIFAFSANLTLFNILNYALLNADRLLVGNLLGTAQLGIYSWGKRLFEVPMNAIVPRVFSVLFPTLARTGSDEKIAQGTIRAACGIALVIFPMVGGIGAVADVFVSGVLKAKWAPLAPILPVLCFRYVLESSMRIGTVLYSVRERTDLQLYWGLGSGAVFLASYFIGMKWGLVGVAAAQVGMMVVLFYPGLRLPLRLIGLGPMTIVRALFPFALATIVMAAGVRGLITLMNHYEIRESVTLGCAISLGIVVYAVTLLALRPPALQDLAKALSRSKSG